MKHGNSISLTGSSGNRCGWYDDWCCAGSCADGCNVPVHCGCTNGCGCANGCSNGCGCANSCGFPAGCGCPDACGCADPCGSQWNWHGMGNACRRLFPGLPPLASGGMLSPRIVASGRACVRAGDLTLCVQDIPEEAQAPFQLLSVTASGPSNWEFLSVERYRAILRVTIPLTVRIRDCSGCIYTGHSSVTVDVPVRITIPQADLCRARVEVMPSVRLLCVDGCSDDGCFTVALAVLVDIYVARWELSSDGVTVPCRPDLPLTLPPSFDCSCRCCR